VEESVPLSGRGIFLWKKAMRNENRTANKTEKREKQLEISTGGRYAGN
jgi:hypothetical protein